MNRTTKTKNYLYLGYCQDGLLIILFNQYQIIDKVIIKIATLSEILILKIDVLLKKYNLNKQSINRIYLNHGPGSFNGIRIVVLTAKTIAHYLKIPLYTCSQLKLQLLISKKSSIIIPAGKNQVYLAWFDHQSQYHETILNDDQVSNFILDHQLQLTKWSIVNQQQFCQNWMQLINHFDLVPDRIRLITNYLKHPI